MRLSKTKKKIRGGGLVEHGIVVGLISVVAIGAVMSLGGAVGNVFSTTSAAVASAQAGQVASSPDGGTTPDVASVALPPNTALPEVGAGVGFSMDLSPFAAVSGGDPVLTYGDLSWSGVPTAASVALSQAGILSGTVLTPGDFFVDATAAAQGASATGRFTFRVYAPPSISIAGGSLGEWRVGDPIATQLSAYASTTGGPTGFGVGDITWSSADVPAWLSLGTTGGLTGTGTTPGTYIFNVTGLAGDATASGAFSLDVYPVEGIVLADANLGEAEAGSSLSFDLKDHATVTGGPTGFSADDITWTSTDAPSGVTVGADGVVSGSLATPGAYSFTASGVSGPASDTGAFTINVYAPASLSFSGTNLGETRVGQAYSSDLKTTATVTGGPSGTTVASYTWAASSGVPTGLTLSSAGVLSGTPTVPGTYNINATATAGASSGAASFQLRVYANETPSLASNSFTSPLQGEAFNFDFKTLASVTGGPSVGARTASDIAWSVTSGSVPTGTTLNPSTGVLSGTVSAQGTYTFTVQAALAPQTVSRSYTIVVAAPPITYTAFESYARDLGPRFRTAWGSASYAGISSSTVGALNLNAAGTMVQSAGTSTRGRPEWSVASATPPLVSVNIGGGTTVGGATITTNNHFRVMTHFQTLAECVNFAQNIAPGAGHIGFQNGYGYNYSNNTFTCGSNGGYFLAALVYAR
jgi:large repetitive protein